MPDTESNSRKMGWLTFAAIATMSVSELANQFSNMDVWAIISASAFCLVSLSILGTFQVREWSLLAMALALTAAFHFIEGLSEPVLKALQTSSFFGAFIFLVTFLKEAAVRSASILDVGRYLTNQREGRRYLSTSIGGHVFGVLLNFAAISLLAPLIQKGVMAQAGSGGRHTELSRILEQRQLSALVRGFSWIVVWAPTALTQAVVLASFPGADYTYVAGLGLFVTILLILTGRIEDKLRWKGRMPPMQVSGMQFPYRSIVNLILVFSILIVSVFSISTFTDKSVAICLMLMAPVLTAGWIAAQNRLEHSGLRTGLLVRTLRDVFTNTVHQQTRSVFVLGMSAFIGTMAAELAPVEAIGETIDFERIPPWIFLSCLPAMITLGGQIALSPIMMVVFLSSVINGLGILPADPALIAFAMASGWALSMTASPNATASLLVSSITGIAPTVLTWRWNGVYALLCYVFICFTFWVLA